MTSVTLSYKLNYSNQISEWWFHNFAWWIKTAQINAMTGDSLPKTNTTTSEHGRYAKI